MKVRNFKDSDYNDVASWWKKQDFTALPTELLSQNGFIVEDEQDKIAATWVYRTDSPIYIMEWTVGNPNIPHDKRGNGLDILLESASNWAKNEGAILLFTMAQHERFMDRLVKNNFTKTDTNMTHFMRRL